MPQYSYQLYCSREFPPLAKTLGFLADAGYTQVEGFGGVYDDPAATRAALDAAGLTMPSAHFSVDALENDKAAVFAIAKTLGVKSIYAPYLVAEERPNDAPGWAAFGEKLETLNGIYSTEGYHFGWHNHDFELHQTSDGAVPMKLILDAAPSIGWEADIAWIIRGGADPFRWIADYGDRISAVHIKDIAPAGECVDEDGWADVGHGTVPWARLMAELVKLPNLRHYIMEHDKPNDDERFARRSINFVRRV